MTVTEDVMVFASDQPLRSLDRDEKLLLTRADTGKGPIKLGREHLPLTVVHYPQEYTARPFAPPRGIYENSQLRIEWQTMDNRQPFYHRNCDVDEISYQIASDRTLMTELGVIEHRPREFSRIPRGVAHDNYGRQESHLLFYIPAPVTELAAPQRTSQPVSPPFPGWQAAAMHEAVTQCMGTPGNDTAVFGVDEKLLLEQVHSESERMNVFSINHTVGTQWFFATEAARLGAVVTSPTPENRRYHRTLDADEIQYQVSGRRTLLTQRGIVDLRPGDFVRIPLGIAHGNLVDEASTHLSLLSNQELPQVAESARTADPYSPARLTAALDRVLP